ncbi:MAG TPA: ribosomal protein S18-alanine N-acetyltransferase [Ornithinibacter sp.]|uniref:ribosomal protein S18-alanine N-acetyltransferase n=1 Tax=Ornithinibacter sp. TaxID=2862748 RepID=UPI002CD68401|nr:ribosomal protein S18-alanine N-acetyltransferase [Ornithinibacter sp.]HOB80566.1 ribosomal protein S18-alanine N-acetyltransferase [Ornithinibacter sp.]HQA14127.1 ribosomal protein S18-alanine N-acetyltransferase [Ornithinibacter sp.]HQD68672.1 ribosomal protein S18-alanine N-acetyltransferase [Ornithinibacter sp.]HQV81527.1 ribosomal protein S18-alanine N-acetyltransferase [Ornithinibacter sp.]HQW73766.1 ribosomal protein S18-alanine N-acetyltransferase [Ornithinibacter sp.]
MSTLRDVHWTDIEQLAQLERELFADDAWSQQTWWAELAGRPRRDYVAEVEGAEVLGYAGLDHGGDVADVMTIAVAPSARGRGLGRRLLDELETRARAGRAASVMLEVRADNAAAIGLYDRAGYTVVSTRRRYYQPGDIDALVMRKILSDAEVGGE